MNKVPEPTAPSPTAVSAWRLPESCGDDVVMLRPWEIGDSATMFEIHQDPAVIAQIDVEHDNRVDSGESAFNMIMKARRRSSRGEGVGIAICRRYEDVMVGTVELDAFDDKNDEAEVSFAVLETDRGPGYAGRALRLVCDWAVQDLGLAAIWAVVDISNEPSRRALDRAGFVEARRAWPLGLRATRTSLVLTLEPKITG